ncbi:hypothetical protein L207DRAFT_415564 [Hyaloscypha variabilis F]|uniref:Zn(2)-C6 fungal-type domain-containing protein n=1 Tax=Hyaloscypha variabilis (strain UAMH 11265 / GT02V1 / F) TaxID=1149755 RepID=A0A2J6SB47_HYAVF|nr:hypothetical protein L207DRAFT_415564 [Hyaloscypha variabilis F]
MPAPRPGQGRKVIRQACDGCRVRKIKCSELPPCDGCTASGIQCTFKKVPKTRGPRTLRPKTVQQITERQRQDAEKDWDRSTHCGSSPDAYRTPSPQTTGTTVPKDPGRTSTQSLELRLSIFRLRLYPVWPVVDASYITAALQNNEGDTLEYALANAVGAATVAQLKLDSLTDTVSASAMEAECCRVKDLGSHRRVASLDTLRIAFFLHVYHENLEPGGVASLSYLREAITLAQIMGLHRESMYAALAPPHQEIRRRILWLLFVTERGVAMLHNLPVVLRCNTHFPSGDGEEDNRVLPAFLKLVNLFWIFDQSGAFDVLQNIDDVAGGLNFPNRSQSSLEVLQKRLQDVPIDWEASNDVQRADICVTRQWMRAVLWRISRLQNSDSEHVTSLSHPIQIAQEFLAVISKLPTAAIESHGPSIEFKVFEIASAVTDALTTNLWAWTFPNNARNILDQLHRILTSSRGGNKPLSTMLRIKIAQIQDKEPLLLEPSARIEELFDRNSTTAPSNIDTEGDAPPCSSFAITRNIDDSILDLGRDLSTESGMDFSQRQRPGPNVVYSELTRTLTNTLDLYEQLQNFDGSFTDLQVLETPNAYIPSAETSETLLGDR